MNPRMTNACWANHEEPIFNNLIVTFRDGEVVTFEDVRVPTENGDNTIRHTDSGIEFENKMGQVFTALDVRFYTFE